ncbi:MAG TPA: hypothetical protein VGF10_03465 [Gaiella sp.]
MTVRAIVGLAALNGAYTVLGVTLLWAFRGLPRWSDVLRLAGLGYLLGLAAFGVVWTQLLVVGVPLTGSGLVVSLVLGTAAAAIAAVLLGRERPRGLGDTARHASTAAVLVTACGIALAGLLLEVVFRSARLQSLQAYDAWAFWVPKAKAIYYFGGLDHELFTTLANATYPPVVPIVDAAAFHAMGSADTSTFHLQYWFLVVGATAAIAGCLYRHVPAWLLWPSLLLVLTVPRIASGLLVPQADVLVDVLFVLAVLLLVLWLRDGRGWRLAATAVLLAGAGLTKREGLLFAAAALGVGLATSFGRRRTAWPRLLVVAALVGAAALPWRLWYSSQGIGGEAPSDAGAGGSVDRMLDALRLSFDVLFDTTLWSVVPVVALVALGAAFVWGDRRGTAFLAAVLGLVFLGGAWVTYAFRELPITADEALNPVVRYTGAIVLLAAVATPLLLASVWRSGPEERR